MHKYMRLVIQSVPSRVTHLSNRVYTKAGEMYSIAVCIKNIVHLFFFFTIYKGYVG